MIFRRALYSQSKAGEIVTVSSHSLSINVLCTIYEILEIIHPRNIIKKYENMRDHVKQRDFPIRHLDGLSNILI